MMTDTIYTLRDVEDGSIYKMTLPMILEHLNEGRSPYWEEYDETDWKEGLAEFTTLTLEVFKKEIFDEV